MPVQDAALAALKELIQFSLAVAILRANWSAQAAPAAAPAAPAEPPRKDDVAALIRKAQAGVLEGMARGVKRPRGGAAPPQEGAAPPQVRALHAAALAGPSCAAFHEALAGVAVGSGTPAGSLAVADAATGGDTPSAAAGEGNLAHVRGLAEELLTQALLGDGRCVTLEVKVLFTLAVFGGDGSTPDKVLQNVLGAFSALAERHPHDGSAPEKVPQNILGAFSALAERHLQFVPPLLEGDGSASEKVLQNVLGAFSALAERHPHFVPPLLEGYHGALLRLAARAAAEELSIAAQERAAPFLFAYEQELSIAAQEGAAPFLFAYEQDERAAPFLFAYEQLLAAGLSDGAVSGRILQPLLAAGLSDGAVSGRILQPALEAAATALIGLRPFQVAYLFMFRVVKRLEQHCIGGGGGGSGSSGSGGGSGGGGGGGGGGDEHCHP
ncbi:hypothetical protein JKP88DRAFT_327986 [Tribonema minus]|uniref:Uncharacterized protein n=1 Tax=Tribonema minus TaxID=303371 RepID=A0A835YQU5_9STRA|nr:hypothetical protein JKP88DRAFT_327986 [Tribonema minus]